MQELQDIYGIKTNFLTYNGIIAAINSFKCLLPNGLIIKKLAYPLRPNFSWIFFKSKNGSQDFYELLNINGKTNITWKKILGKKFILHLSNIQ